MPSKSSGLRAQSAALPKTTKQARSNATKQTTKAIARKSTRAAAEKPDTMPTNVKKGVSPYPLADVMKHIGVEAYTISFGPRIAAELLCAANADNILRRLNDVRCEVARETGLVINGVHLRDDIHLGEDEYVIHVRDTMYGRAKIESGKVMLLGNDAVLSQFEGLECREPVYALKAKWITPDLSADAKAAKGMIFDPLSVIASHFAQAARDTLWQTIMLDHVAYHMKHFRKKNPLLVDEYNARISLQTTRKILIHLCAEYVWPRDPVAFLQAVLDACPETHDPKLLSESVRRVLVPNMLVRKKFRSLQVCKIDRSLQTAIDETLAEQGTLMDTDLGRYIRKEVYAFAKGMPKNQAFLLTSQKQRRAIADLFVQGRIPIWVYAKSEIPNVMSVKTTLELSAPMNDVPSASVPSQPTGTAETPEQHL
jgi:flagellar biosynthesis protein FlhA